MPWESLITAISSNIVPVIAAIITAAGSIIGIIVTQHLRVKKEIELRRKIELFDRKQKAYRKILKILSKMEDHITFLGTPVNWKILRYAYNEIILVGSKEVVDKTNELLHDDSPDSSKSDIKIANLWNAIRKDLYGEELSVSDIHMIGPSPTDLKALSLHDKHFDKLKSVGIDTLEKTSGMDIDSICNKTQINTDELNSIKKMAKNQLDFDDELKRFVEDE